jgi:hypothetical protein
MEDFLTEFRQIIRAAEEELLKISEAESEARPAPDQWSAKEVLGHLIDSAANNHRRFVEAQWKENLVFAGYDQERWVAVQQYRGRPWPELVALWRAYNLSEAEIHDDYIIPPLNQTLEETEAEFESQLVLKATIDGRIIGSASTETGYSSRSNLAHPRRRA